jgi:hypothetical protein
MKEIKFFPTKEETELGGNPPQPASKFVPDWYKKMPKYMNGDTKLRMPSDALTHNHTMKKCVPFLDAMTAGYMFSLDDDLLIEQVNGDPYIRWKSDVELVTWHNRSQFPGFEIPEDYHFMVAKFGNGWNIKTPKGYSLLCTHPINRFDLPFKVITGFVDTDNYVMSIQFPFLLKKGYEGIIKAGTPLAQLIPVKRDYWNSTVEKFDARRQYSNKRKFWRTFANSYRENFWVKKKYQ